MIDCGALLTDLQKQVRSLEDDLRSRALTEAAAKSALHTEWQQARKAERIAATFETWLDDRVTQAAVAWVLATVFVRFCEDNGLIELPYLAGTGERLDVAKERQVEFFRRHPELTDRDWITESFDALSVSKVAAGLFDRSHNPLWTILPTHDAAQSLLSFWRTTDAEGAVRHDFADPSWDTRFLGDLYQDLSDHAKKTYALLQTPEFVEEFILDRTLEPAIDEFGLEGLRLIDPTCGSGHFLLGAFHRILAKWEVEAPGADRWTLIHRTLRSVHGVDKNPFAVAIARFRLMLAAMKAGSVSTLAKAPDFPLVIATGDSLLHGREAPNRKVDLFGELVYYFDWEDVDDYIKQYDLLGMASYHVVVGNPPYRTVEDGQENQNYREGYPTCSGTYALSIPFAERFFRLAKRAAGNRVGSGHIGQITANSFMKRGFGKKLVESWFRLQVELTEVIDTSGAYIPGHGTPTVILVGRNQVPASAVPVRAVMGVRGEPSQPEVAAEGLVWTAIARQIEMPGSPSEWVSITDLERTSLANHPWSLSGGGASALRALLEECSTTLLSAIEPPIGRGVRVGADEAYLRPKRWSSKTQLPRNAMRPWLSGDSIRDWRSAPQEVIFYPYGANIADEFSAIYLWHWRRILEERRTFQGNMADADLDWWQYMQHTLSAYTTPLSIAFAFVSTHNHFVLDRGGNIFNRHSPVVKLAGEATEDRHLGLMAILNSSTACFWLKQVSYPKGGDPIGDDGARVSAESWSDRYEFTGGALQNLPVPERYPLLFGRSLQSLAERLSTLEPSAVCDKISPNRALLDASQIEHMQIHGRMIALQEELDWEVYGLYKLIDERELAELQADANSVPDLKLGERAFEIVLARKMAAGEVETQWFARHGSTPITEIPGHWPEPYQRVVARRIEVIEGRKDIALIERPECKRRWVTIPWEKKEREALRNWLLDRCEARELWFSHDANGREQPEPMTVNRLADKLRTDSDMVSVARLYAGRDADLADVLAEIVSDEHVSYLAALRYKETGMRKRAQWEATWDMQREEDATGKRLDIPVPPKYTSADFRKTSFWRNRGKLDVPKERFISYPDAGPELDRSVLLGWAGWDHREQAHALMTIIDERGNDGWDAERMTPLVAGLAEVLPWVKQWHGEVDPEFGQSWADAYAGYLEAQRLKYELTDEHLATWRPATARGRK